jgi:hypothetical protein
MRHHWRVRAGVALLGGIVRLFALAKRLGARILGRAPEPRRFTRGDFERMDASAFNAFLESIGVAARVSEAAVDGTEPVSPASHKTVPVTAQEARRDGAPVGAVGRGRDRGEPDPRPLAETPR